MSNVFKMIVLLGIGFTMVTGCTPQERQEGETREPSPTLTASLTETPIPNIKHTPVEAEPSVAPRPTVVIPTQPEAPLIEEGFVREGIPVPKPEEVIGVENADRLVELARWGYGAINRVIHSADGQLMLVQSDAGVYAYHLGTLDEVWRFQSEAEISSIDIGQDENVKVQVGGALIYKLDTANGKLLEITEGEIEWMDQPIPGEPVYPEESSVDQTVIDTFFEQVNVPPELGFRGISPSGNYLVFTGEMSTVLVYRVNDYSLVLLFDPENSLGMVIPHMAKSALTSGVGNDYIGPVAFNSSESYLIAANGEGEIYFFDLERGELNVAVHGNGRQLMIPPFGDSVIYFDEDTIEIYAIPSGKRETDLNFGLGVQLLLFSPGGTRLALGAVMWNTQNGTFQTIPENEQVINFSQNGSYVYAIRKEWWWVERRTADFALHDQVYLKIERTDQFEEWEIRMFFHDPFWSHSTEDNQITAYTPLFNPTWSTQTGEMMEMPEDDLFPENSFDSAISPTGAVRAEISGEAVLLKDSQTREVLGSLDVSLWGGFRLAFSPDGRYLAVASSNGVIRLFGVMPPN